MCVSEGVTMVGGKEVMGDSLVVEFVGRKPMPHPLAVARLEVMRPSIAPHLNAVEVIVELLVVEEEEPHGEDEMIVVLIAGGGSAQEAMP